MEFAAAAAAGALLAAIAVQALRPHRSAVHRVQQEVRKPLEAARSASREASSSARQAVRDSGRAAGSFGDLGQEFVRAATREVGAVLDSATPGRKQGLDVQGAFRRLRELAGGSR
ncbi:MAG: hypothetical protein EA352_00260 [Gemmatimonadales bacterium]|nr:MAG: hypothetical protein EA352_00260 [Gemmatimonadales bacterium]